MRSRWLVFFPVAVIAFFAPLRANAAPVIGLHVRGYTVTEIPPIKSDNAYTQCGEETLQFINATWDYEQNLFGTCGWDLFMLHYQGFIQIPEHETIQFWVASDDGGTVKIGLDEFGVWQDQGCSATETGYMDIAAGTQTLDAWFYENGGGTCFMLAWNIDDTGWEIVQPEYFTNEPLVAATTTVAALTTVATTTTVVAETTTTMAATAILETTTTTSTTTTTTTSTTTTTTTTQPIPVPVLDTEPPQSTEQANITSTSEASADFTPTTEPEPVIEPVVVPASTIPELIEEAETTTTTTIPEPLVEDQPLDEAVFAAAIEELDTATAAEIVAVVEQLLAYDLTSEQATELVTSPAVLAAVSEAQAHELFAQLDISEVDATVLEVLVAVVQDAPTEVRAAFEDEIDIFGGYTDTYVPLGSSVTVSVRRSLIAASATLSVMAAPVVATKRDRNVGIPKR
jgi:hypothetical protein